MTGALLASPFERLPPVGGRCRAATKRGQGVTEGDGEGAPAPLRGAAAAAAEGPSNRRSAKKVQRRRPPPAADTGRSCWGSGQQDTSAAQGTKWTLGTATRLSEAASFFVWSPSSLGLKGASSPFLVGPARRNRWHFSGSLLVPKENISRRAASASKSLRPCRAEHAAFASQTGLRLKSPTGAFMPSGHRRPFWFSFVRQKRTSSSGEAFPRKSETFPLCAENISFSPPFYTKGCFLSN